MNRLRPLLAAALAAALCPPWAWGSAPEQEAAEPSYGFHVEPRQDKLRYYPCDQCHKFLPVNHEERPITPPHLKDQPHGDQRFWCLTCHDPEDRNQLRTMKGEQVGFDEAYRVCESCHARRAQDWRGGAHGKRVGTWQGERRIYSCTECHDAHDPPIVAVKPDAPPPPRIGFPPPRDHGVSPPPVWEALFERDAPSTGHGGGGE